MKRIVISLLVFAPFVLVAQEHESKNNGVVIGVSYSPDYCYRDLKGDGTDATKTNVALRNSVESAKYGFTTGLSLRSRLAKNLQIETGLYFADRGERLVIDRSALTFGDMIDPISGLVNEASSHQGTIVVNNQYMYIDIPVKLNYIIFDKKISLTISGGTSLNTMVASNAFSTANLNRSYWWS